MLGTIFAAVAVVAFLIIGLVKRLKGDKASEASPKIGESLIMALVSGAVASNGLFHFIHGVLDLRDFPAPFAVVLGGGILMNISNVIWGLLNLSLAVMIWRRNQKSQSLRWFVFGGLFFIGFATISLLLRFVFLSGYFETHRF